MRYSEFSAIAGERLYKCAVCGEEYGQGGIWSRTGEDITICPDDECIRSILHLAIDALLDGPFMDDPEGLTKYWQAATTDALKFKKEEDAT